MMCYHAPLMRLNKRIKVCIDAVDKVIYLELTKL